ncbi:hypothetical protein [Cetobacterium sp.]|uniref:toxin-antitoxin system YwqK family antitoxin n=1 Tax=Cetobacterium sp. TaxID=2071632 RepID=UPI003F2BA90F
MHKYLVTSFDRNRIHLNKSFCDLFYLIDYLPRTSYGVQEGQSFISNFKNGIYLQYYTDILTEALEEILGYDRENYIIIPIVASKYSTNEKRYKNLLENLSKNLSIENGYSYVTHLFDTFEKHNLDDKFIVKDNFQINLEKLEGKKIIIIDDVYTSGRSFEQYYFQINKKIDSLIGIFLGKTNSKITENIESSLNNFRFYKYTQILDLKKRELLPFNNNGKNIEYKSEGIYEEYYLKDGIKNGKAFTFYLNGKYEEYFYLNNIKHGESYLYNSNGNIEVTFYKNGLKENRLITKYLTGAKEESILVNDKKHGVAKFYSTDGKCYSKYYEYGVETKLDISNLNKDLLSDGMKKIFKRLNLLTENVLLKKIDTISSRNNFKYSEFSFVREFGLTISEAFSYLHCPKKIFTSHIEKDNYRQIKIENNEHKFFWDFSNSNYTVESLDEITFKVTFTTVQIFFDDSFKINFRGCTNFISREVKLVCIFEDYSNI